jgi:hypothetical protein
MLYRQTIKFISLALVLGLLLRALLPTGFMPDLLAAQQGLFKITICAANGTQNVFVDKQMQPHSPKTPQHKPCDFALSQHLTWLVLAIGLLTLLVWPWQKIRPILVHTQLRPIFKLGNATPRGPPAG